MAPVYFSILLLSVCFVCCCNGYTESTDYIKDDFAVGHAKKFKCPSLFGAFPDPDSCSFFYVCLAGYGTRTACPFMNGFDVRRRKCVSILIADCGNKKKDDETTKAPNPVTTNPNEKFKCPRMSGTFPDPRDCSKYYRCTFFIPISNTCPEGKLFDGVHTDCRDGDSVHCGNRIRPGGFETTAAEKETTTEAPSTTTESDEPTFPTISEVSTPEETPKPPETTTIVEEVSTRPTGPPDTDCDEDDLDCIITDTGEEPEWFECPEDVGSYPHPSSRKLFIFCLNWKPSVKKCGQDLVFDEGYGTCVKEEIVNESQ